MSAGRTLVVWIDEGIIADAGAISVGQEIQWSLFDERPTNIDWLAKVIGPAEASKVGFTLRGDGKSFEVPVRGVVSQIQVIVRIDTPIDADQPPFLSGRLEETDSAMLCDSQSPRESRIGFLVELVDVKLIVASNSPHK